MVEERFPIQIPKPPFSGDPEPSGAFETDQTVEKPRSSDPFDSRYLEVDAQVKGQRGVVAVLGGEEPTAPGPAGGSPTNPTVRPRQ